MTQKQEVTAPAGQSITVVAGAGKGCLLSAFLLSLLVNVIAVTIVVIACIQWFGGEEDSGNGLPETYHSGTKGAEQKIAIIEMNGIILEGLLNHVYQQIKTAKEDDNVKAVVLRINSPGGTITGSEKLYQKLIDLRNGTGRTKSNKKPIIVSMGSLAASGGYFISMPAEKIFAERTTMTGSIGVFASFPNLAELGKKVGFKMIVVKRGEVKTGGSPFHAMTPNERAVWEDLIDDAYQRFIAIVEKGRPKLRGKMRETVIDQLRLEKPEEGYRLLSRAFSGIGSSMPLAGLSVVAAVPLPKTFRYTRRRADGGIYTAPLALRYGLIDQIGSLDDAIDEAAKLAGLGSDYQAIQYVRSRSVAEMLLGLEASKGLPSMEQWQQGLTPRVWYLAPNSELAGVAATMRKQ